MSKCSGMLWSLIINSYVLQLNFISALDIRVRYYLLYMSNSYFMSNLKAAIRAWILYLLFLLFFFFIFLIPPFCHLDHKLKISQTTQRTMGKRLAKASKAVPRHSAALGGHQQGQTKLRWWHEVSEVLIHMHGPLWPCYLIQQMLIGRPLMHAVLFKGLWNIKISQHLFFLVSFPNL